MSGRNQRFVRSCKQDRDLVPMKSGRTKPTKVTLDGRYYLYILSSVKCRKTYVGQTENLAIRLKRHNAGLVRSTKACLPWVVLHEELHRTRAGAMKRERWFKSPAGRMKIASLLENVEVDK